MNIRDVKDRFEKELMDFEGVVGVGIGVREGEECIIVFVKKIDKKIVESIPKNINRYKVYIEEVGKLIKYK